MLIINYCIAGNVRGVQFSRMVDLYPFAGLIFADLHTYVLYNRTYFTGLIFAVRQSSAKTMELDPSKISCYTVYTYMYMYMHSVLLMQLKVTTHITLLMMMIWAKEKGMKLVRNFIFDLDSLQITCIRIKG